MANLMVPDEAVSIRLYRFVKDELIGCEEVTLKNGASSIDTVLRRAAISGHVRVGEKFQDHFADLLDKDGIIVASVELDKDSYRMLKTKWLRCKVQRCA